MEKTEELMDKIKVIEKRLGYSFNRRELLISAFLHRSYLNENRTLPYSHNERLEFLGDTVLGLLISEFLFDSFPDLQEGDLSFLRSRLVEAASCTEYVKLLDLQDFLLLGKGERINVGRGRESILADLFEAIVGAIYLDGGVQAVKTFLFDNYQQTIDQIIQTPISNWKALLQDWSQKRYQTPPVYEVLKEVGPDHSKIFEVAVFINEEKVGTGSGSSKKEAQQEAAKVAYEALNHGQT